MTGVIATIPRFQFSNALGLPLAGGKLYTYVAGTTTMVETYQDQGLTTANENPIPLDSTGSCVIWLDPDKSYKFLLKSALGITQPGWPVDNISGASSLLSLAPTLSLYVKLTTLAANAGTSLIGFLQAGVGAVKLTLQDMLREWVTPQQFGAEADGVTDDVVAIEKALATGKAVDFGDATKIYFVSRAPLYTGQVHIRAKGATIKGDCKQLWITDGSGSRVRGLKILPATIPYTVTRNPTTWAASAVSQTLLGYMPTSQDTDIWAGLPAYVKAQFDNFDPRGIYFDVSSTDGGSDIEISGITGAQCTITLEGYSDSTVQNCNFGARREGIVFRNALAAQNGAFTLPRGANNRVIRNTIAYASQSGILWMGNDGGLDQGNVVHDCGESGFKTAQHDASTGPEVISTRMKIDSNEAFNCYYDGIDAQAVYGIPGVDAYDTYNVISNCQSHHNRHTGATINGSHNRITGFTPSFNGSHGLNVQGSHTTVADVNADRNSAHPEIHAFQIFDILIQGDGHVGSGNYVFNPDAPSTWNYVHTGALGVDPSPTLEGLDIGNRCSHGPDRMFISETIPTTETLMVGAGTRAKTDSAVGVFRQDGAGADIGGRSNIGYVRVRGDATTSARLDFTTNDTDPTGSPGFQGRILYDFANSLIRFAVNGAAQSVYLQNGVGFFPSPDNALSLGAADLRWTQVYAASSTISTSDGREKQQIQSIDTAAFRAIGRVNFCQFKFNDAVELKGDNARWHFGVVAQQVKEAFEAEGLDPFAYGMLCYDKWDKAEAIAKEGVEVMPAREAGDRYGIRYEELLTLGLAYLFSQRSAT